MVWPRVRAVAMMPPALPLLSRGTAFIISRLLGEAKTPKPNTLGQFFTEWGVRLTSTCVADFCDPDTSVAVYVDGKPYSGDPAAIELTFEEEIAVVVGAPPAVIPDSADFSNA